MPFSVLPPQCLYYSDRRTVGPPCGSIHLEMPLRIRLVVLVCRAWATYALSRRHLTTPVWFKPLWRAYSPRKGGLAGLHLCRGCMYYGGCDRLLSQQYRGPYGSIPVRSATTPLKTPRTCRGIAPDIRHLRATETPFTTTSSRHLYNAGYCKAPTTAPYWTRNKSVRILVTIYL